MDETLTGQYNKAHLTTSQIEEGAKQQVQNMMDAEGFSHEKPAVIMPDAHYGAGAVVGFTMPLLTDPLRIVPACVGVDLGCGMIGVDLGKYSEGGLDLEAVDEKIRNQVPTGFSVHGRGIYHMRDDFPYKQATQTLAKLSEAIGRPLRPDGFDPDKGYTVEYMRALCERGDEEFGRAINAMGTLGGGNHFIELAVSEKNQHLWCIVHSGSRGVGESAGSAWIERAARVRSMDDVRRDIPNELTDYVKFDPASVSNQNLFEWLTGGKGESYLKKESIREDFEGKKIEDVFNALGNELSAHHDDTDRAYLEGKEADTYLGDLNIMQWYARENRKTMAQAVAKAVGRDIQDSIESIHNYIDFRDGIIRKGATPARQGQRGVVPLNMRDGTLLIEGRGNPNWNQSSPHGAGRIMGRRDAEEELDPDSVEQSMEGIYTRHIPIDEAPQAYKSASMIREAIKPTAKIVDHLTPILNVKNDDEKPPWEQDDNS